MVCTAFATTVAVLLSVAGQTIFAQPIEWPMAAGGNGHYYELIEVTEDTTWYEARTEAESLTFLGVSGHLATITSQAESDFIYVNLVQSAPSLMYWVGAYQPVGSPEPDGGWEWITGEAWSYTNWAAPEPNNTPPGEEVAEIYSNLVDNPASYGKWNDAGGANLGGARVGNYVVEYSIADYIPTVSEWGLVAMTLLVLAAGTLLLMRRRVISA